ncbi:MAG: methyl-accepting chemotaxis protein [Pseudomonadota bacterium]
MNAFTNLKVGRKLLISFSMMIILMGIIGITGYLSMNKIQMQLNTIFAVRLPSIDYLIEADRDLQQLLVAERSMIFTDVKSDEFKTLLDEYNENLEQAKMRWEKYKSLASTPEELAIISQFEKAREEWQAISRKVVDARMTDSSQGRREAIDLTKTIAKEKFETMRDFINKLTELNLSIAQKADDFARNTYSRTTLYLFVILGFGILIGIGFTWIISRQISKPINKLVIFAEHLRNGNLKARLQDTHDEKNQDQELSKHVLTNRKDEIGVLLSAMDKMRDSLVAKAEVAEKIAGGELSTKVEILSDQDILGKSLSIMVENLNRLTDEINQLTGAISDGRLSIRGKSDRFQGGWKNLVNNINDLIESFVRPINMTSDYINRISSGDIPEKITTEYKGDFNKTKENLNQCVDIIKGLLNEIMILIEAVDAGDLAKRGNHEKYSGNWGTLVKGINDLISAFVTPFKLTASYIDRMSKGDIPELIQEAYKGDFNEIKSNLNSLISANIDVTNIAQEISNGNLKVKVEKRSKEDQLMASLDRMLKGLTHIVVNVQTAANQVAAGSQQINTSGQQMSQGSTEQAASVEEISSSMEQMNSTVQQTADNAKETATIAQKAALNAEEGGKAVSETVLAMNTISAKISIVEEIARQTNMLALNAAIEAARAGEHGKGFAVVAAEVRKLAERSQSAAKEISTYSTTSVEISEKAGKLLENIVPNIKRTSELVQEISAASSEQASGINQVSEAISQLDQIIQQNAAATEEMASTSEELTDQADHLKEVIAFFKIDEQEILKRAEFRGPESSHPRMHDEKSPSYAHLQHDAPKKGITLKMDYQDDSEFEQY